MSSSQSVRFAAVVLLSGAVLASALGLQPSKETQDQKPAPKPDQQQEQPRERGPGGRGGQPGQGQPVGGGMKGMNRSLRTLKGQIQDASKREENLSLIGAMQIACIAAKGGKLDDVLKDAKDDGERAAKTKHFRSEMITLARLLLDVEEAILNEKYDAAQVALDKAQAQRDHGHEEFGVKED